MMATHIARFYERDTSLMDSVVDFIGGALRTGDAAVVIATPEHRAELVERLSLGGLRLDEAEASGRFVSLDANTTLSMLLRAGVPDHGLTVDVLGPVLDRAALGGRRVHVFGEMVALLKAAGQGDAAVLLEQSWNALQASRRFVLFCAYPLQLFAGSEHGESMSSVCREHGVVVPTESYSGLELEDERGAAVALLQQKAISLEAEIARRKNAEERLLAALEAEREAREAAENALRIREQFLSIASHELRTPLASLSGRAQLALRRMHRNGRVDPERAGEAFEQIKSHADKLAWLIDQLLDISRIESGKLALDFSRVELAEFVTQNVSAAQSRTEHHSFTWTIEEGLWVEADALRLEQVITNLLDNAIKYSPDGGAICVTARRATDGTVELAVRDHGLGIPPERRAHIFERFYQAHEASGRGGMGLGLFISRQIVELHGGTIRVEFPPGGGTRFVVALPGQAVHSAPSALSLVELAAD